MKEDELLAANEALERFSQHAPRKAELVKLLYFAGMGLREAGQVLGISEPTAVRWWMYAKTTIQTAVNAAQSNDTVRLAPGVIPSRSPFYANTSRCWGLPAPSSEPSQAWPRLWRVTTSAPCRCWAWRQLHHPARAAGTISARRGARWA